MPIQVFESQMKTSEDKTKLISYPIKEMILDDKLTKLCIVISNENDFKVIDKRLNLHYETAGLDNTPKCQFKHHTKLDKANKTFEILLRKKSKAQNIQSAVEFIALYGWISPKSREEILTHFPSPQEKTTSVILKTRVPEKPCRML